MTMPTSEWPRSLPKPDAETFDDILPSISTELLLNELIRRGVGRWWDHGELSPGQHRFVSKWLDT